MEDIHYLMVTVLVRLAQENQLIGIQLDMNIRVVLEMR